jgi:murein DD-endopeptidase MepM/ murein hydrolase activator NlpD
LVTHIDNREQQLAMLDKQLAARDTRLQTFVAGKPVTKGWMSSSFGRRTDPFSGKQSWHEGVDFAGDAGVDVIAVASGVVTHAGRKSGYGNIVELNHGNGYVTRYAHNDTHRVSTGDIVEKGQVIATMGSSGRSTGPHVHFEVLKNGEPMNPERYIYRASL